MRIGTKLLKLYFDFIYNHVYDFMVGQFAAYHSLLNKCVHKLELGDGDKVLCVGVGTGNEIVHVLGMRKNVKIIDVDYRDIDSYLEFQPVKLTLLSPGTFEHYYQEKAEEGVDLAHLKPPHMNAPDAIIERLLQLSEQAQGERGW